VASYAVTSASDSGPGTLRQALLTADYNAGATAPTITFNLPGPGVPSIALASPLPTVTAPVLLDGLSQPGSGTAPRVELNGSAAGAGANGLVLAGGNSTVRGLGIGGFSGVGVVLQGSGGDALTGNYIGTNATGTAAHPNALGGASVLGTSNNTIGGTNPGEGNVISANLQQGVLLSGGGASGNRLLGNLIGLGAGGATALGNGSHNVYVLNAPGNTVGGTAAVGAGNVISASGASGVLIEGAGATGNRVQGNYIGTDASGTLARGNAGNGVAVLGASGNTVGAEGNVGDNVVSGNGGAGISLSGAGATGNVVVGNFVGTDASGAVALPNGTGITLSAGAANNTIGTAAIGGGNLVSGNRGHGVSIDGAGTSGNVLVGNYVGTDGGGGFAIPNGGSGVYLSDAPGNTIGSLTAGAFNLISANAQSGVLITGAGASGNVVIGNLIGVASDGGSYLGNGGNGVALLGGAHDNTIGGTAAGAGNTIAYSGNDGVLVDTGTGNAVLSNLLFGNFNLGIELLNGGNNNQAAPTLTSATTSGSSLTVSGTFAGQSSSSYTLQFYANPDPTDPEGTVLLGTVTVTTDATGAASFTFSFGAVPPGWVVTATATDAAGNTSAFSAAVTVS
jgi:hypothetical protein